jgi:hypothetical protein
MLVFCGQQPRLSGCSSSCNHPSVHALLLLPCPHPCTHSSSSRCCAALCCSLRPQLWSVQRQQQPWGHSAAGQLRVCQAAPWPQALESTQALARRWHCWEGERVSSATFSWGEELLCGFSCTCCLIQQQQVQTVSLRSSISSTSLLRARRASPGLLVGLGKHCSRG